MEEVATLEDPRDEQVPALATVLAQIPDRRAARGCRYPWAALLLVMVAGVLSGANSQRALARWGRDTGPARRRRLGVTRARSPSQSTLQRVRCRVDVAVLERLVGQWVP